MDSYLPSFRMLQQGPAWTRTNDFLDTDEVPMHALAPGKGCETGPAGNIHSLKISVVVQKHPSLRLIRIGIHLQDEILFQDAAMLFSQVCPGTTAGRDDTARTPPLPEGMPPGAQHPFSGERCLRNWQNCLD